MSLQRFMLMTELEANRFRTETAGASHGLDPIAVRGGDRVGLWALPERVKDSPHFPQYADDFAALEVAELETNVAFPPPEEEDE